MKKGILVTAIVGLLVASGSFAQYIGPSSTSKLNSIEEVKKNASQLDKTDTMVKVKGRIVEQINKDTFWFEDATGRILVEIETKHFPSFPIDEKTEVIIIGEVDYDLLEEVEIEVESIQIVK